MAFWRPATAMLASVAVNVAVNDDSGRPRGAGREVNSTQRSVPDTCRVSLSTLSRRARFVVACSRSDFSQRRGPRSALGRSRLSWGAHAAVHVLLCQCAPQSNQNAAHAAVLAFLTFTLAPGCIPVPVCPGALQVVSQPPPKATASVAVSVGQVPRYLARFHQALNLPGRPTRIQQPLHSLLPHGLGTQAPAISAHCRTLVAAGPTDHAASYSRAQTA
ncbi:hypothetical protein BDV96DRAFT_251153 [Lophiotrema nucula]|uniref:Secreted protein n=1 Tax=Lophiotrema nucula TaxID=690887 RepID=A0A6A5YQ73_9PLEO|nr:hypothetical protein BDV96DRAFT_251153 [Lophiotrema nucula]